MSLIKKLGGQTIIYGFSSIIGRFLNYLLVPLYTRQFAPDDYGIVTEVYAYAGFLIVLLTYGMETAFFRFNQKYKGDNLAFSSGLWSLILTSSAFLFFIFVFITPISELLLYEKFPRYILMLAAIVALDAVTALPFARLREQEKAMKFASFKMVNIGVNILLNLFLILLLPEINNSTPVIDYIFIANLAASAVTMLLLLPEFRLLKYGFHYSRFKEMLVYSIPLMIAGLAGMVNEMIDRTLLRRLLPYSEEENLRLLGIYGATYKLSILMTLFTQAFRYAAEPIFFKKSDSKDAPEFYALVLKYFTYFGCIVFLSITLFIDQVKFFLGSDFHSGIVIVPILLLANLFLAMQVNLSIWYKIKDKTKIGAMIAIIGASITIVLNLLWIPEMGYVGSAWATLICYFVMATLTYFIGKRYYPIPYELPRIIFSIVFSIMLFLLGKHISGLLPEGVHLKILMNILLLIFFITVIYISDKRALSRDIGLKKQ
ncbi:MAG: oligosaccharide flippase family protein [Chitinophagales bacterium]|nr:oligosaccharide flippase family protein [Chitinophagales bacterium]